MAGVASVCRPTNWAGPSPSRKSLNWLLAPRFTPEKIKLERNTECDEKNLVWNLLPDHLAAPVAARRKTFQFLSWALIHSCPALCSTTTASCCHYVAICLPSVTWRVQAKMISYALIIPHPQNEQLHIQIIINGPLVCRHDSSFQATVAWALYNPVIFQSRRQNATARTLQRKQKGAGATAWQTTGGGRRKLKTFGEVCGLWFTDFPSEL